MKGGKKLVKKGIQKQKLHHFNHTNNANNPTHTNHTDNANITNHIKFSKEINIVKKIKSEIKQKQIKQSRITILKPSDISKLTILNQELPSKAAQDNVQLKTILKQAHQLRKAKSDDKFSNYKSLINNYQQHNPTYDQPLKQTIQSKHHQQSLKQLLDQKYHQTNCIQSINPSQSKPLENQLNSTPTDIKQTDKLLTSSIDLSLKQKQIEKKYLDLQQNYKEILITTKNQIHLYQQQKLKLLSFKTQHFHHQNLLESLRTQYFAKDVHQLPINQQGTINIAIQQRKHYNSVEFGVQTQIPYSNNPIQKKLHSEQIIDDQLQRAELLKVKNRELVEEKKCMEIKRNPSDIQLSENPKSQQGKKYKTQNNWFESSKLSIIQKEKMNRLNRQEEKSYSQNKRYSTYSQKYLEKSLIQRDKREYLQKDDEKRPKKIDYKRQNNCEDEQENKKSRTSIKRKKWSLLSSSSMKNSYQLHQPIRNQQLQKEITKQEHIQKEMQKETPRLNKQPLSSERQNLSPSKLSHVPKFIEESQIKKNGNLQNEGKQRSIKKNLTDEKKKTFTQIKTQNLKASRLSQKSMKSVRRDLFGAKKSEYLDQFRKQVRKQLNLKKSQEFISENQYKETFGSKEKFQLKDDHVVSEKLKKSRMKERNCDKREQIKQENNGIDGQEFKDNRFTKVNTMKSLQIDCSEVKQGNGEQEKLMAAPETPIYKFYQSRKPISPSSALSKYRFKPSIKIP